MEFPYPTYSRYRTLHLTEPQQQGSDVWALQIALIFFGATLAVDGILGPRTSAATTAYQKANGLFVDGLAGGATQMKLTRQTMEAKIAGTGVPSDLIRGQLDHESSDRLGAYSARRTDGSYDAGVTQRNTAHTPPSEGFQPVISIQALIARVKTAYALYEGVADLHRRWGLAAANWNGPAYACYIANEEGAHVPKNQCAAPTSDARTKIEAYIASVTAYFKE